jgi:hypothetical protein
LRESVAVTLRLTAPPEATGLGVPLGPLVIVTVSAVEVLTVSVKFFVSLCPSPSLAVTVSVQVFGLPVVFAGAVQVGFWMLALLKLPLGRPEQRADQL